MPKTASPTTLDPRIVGLAAIAIRLFDEDEYLSRPPARGSIFDCERAALATVLIPAWRAVSGEERECVMAALDRWATQLARAIEDLGARYDAALAAQGSRTLDPVASGRWRVTVSVAAGEAAASDGVGRTCPVCGASLAAQRSDARFCTASCRRETARVTALLAGRPVAGYPSLDSYQNRRRRRAKPAQERVE